jgi:hypothetical protein
LECLFSKLKPCVAVGNFTGFHYAQQGFGGELGWRRMRQFDDGLIWFGQLRRLGKKRGSQQQYRVSPHTQKFTIDAKELASRLAPPTSAPSISGCAIRPRILSGLTLPP